MESNIGICVQAGIADHGEYMYLAEPDYLKKMQSVEKLRRIPSQLCGYESWRYFGIDADCSSMQHLMNNYRNNKWVQWILAYVTGNRDAGYDHPYLSPLVTTQMWLEWTRQTGGSADVAPTPEYLMPTVSLESVFKALDLKRIDVLALDIEGNEMPFFETYSWEVQPAYINVEVHTYPEPLDYEILCRNKDRIIEIITAAGRGYKLLHSFDSNIVGGITHTHELHFLRRDVVESDQIYGVNVDNHN